VTKLQLIKSISLFEITCAKNRPTASYHRSLHLRIVRGIGASTSARRRATKEHLVDNEAHKSSGNDRENDDQSVISGGVILLLGGGRGLESRANVVRSIDDLSLSDAGLLGNRLSCGLGLGTIVIIEDVKLQLAIAVRLPHQAAKICEKYDVA